jgi:hypothetical protein
VLQYYGVGRTKFIIEAQQEDGQHDGQDDIQMAANKNQMLFSIKHGGLRN